MFFAKSATSSDGVTFDVQMGGAGLFNTDRDRAYGTVPLVIHVVGEIGDEGEHEWLLRMIGPDGSQTGDASTIRLAGAGGQSRTTMVKHVKVNVPPGVYSMELVTVDRDNPRRIVAECPFRVARVQSDQGH